MVSGGYEQALAPLLVLLLGRMIGGTFVGVLVPLRLALGTIKNHIAEAWLVAMLRSSLVVHEPLRPSLWTRDS